MSELSKVFVYGTLKKGKHNHGLMGSSSLIAEAKTKSKFFMHDIGFPQVFEKPLYQGHSELPVVGEVYEVDSNVLQDLDWLEGVPDHYVRKTIVVQYEGGQECECYMYVTHPDHANSRSHFVSEANESFAKDYGWDWQ